MMYPFFCPPTRRTQDQIAAVLVTIQSELAARGGLPFVGLVNNAGVTGKADPVRGMRQCVRATQRVGLDSDFD